MPELSPPRPHHIRSYEPRDAIALAELFRRSVTMLGPDHYSAEQVEAWAASIPSAEQLRARWSDGRIVLVAVDADNRPVAFADLERDGHIDCLCCAPEVAGSAIPSELYDRLEALARGRGLPCLYVQASKPTKALFDDKGFALTHRLERAIHGVPIHVYAMNKRL